MLAVTANYRVGRYSQWVLAVMPTPVGRYSQHIRGTTEEPLKTKTEDHPGSEPTTHFARATRSSCHAPQMQSDGQTFECATPLGSTGSSYLSPGILRKTGAQNPDTDETNQPALAGSASPDRTCCTSHASSLPSGCEAGL